VTASPTCHQVDILAAVHRDHSVDLRATVVATDVLGESRVAAVALSDGSRIDADVVVGIGVTPNTEWLEHSRLTIDNGTKRNARIGGGRTLS
jgi:NAD(P)H-nitrite reductase large subunit